MRLRNKGAWLAVPVEAMKKALESAIRTAAPRIPSEDRVAIIECDDALVVVAADGAGGLSGGGIASDMVVEVVRARTRERPFDPYDVRRWSELMSEADGELARTPRAGETTAIIVVVGTCGVVGVSAGDSEVWVVKERRVDRLTEKQNRIRLGTGWCQPTAFHQRALEGVLVAGTDGLFRHAGSQSIIACCSSSNDVDDVADGLVALPKLRSSNYPDDIALAVVRAVSSP